MVDLKTVENTVLFDSATHTYSEGGVIIPSVTQIMEPLSAKTYQFINPDVLARAAERGTAVHEAIDFHISTGMDEIEDGYKPYFEAFMDWESFERPTYLANEYTVFHRELGYAGTADIIAEIDGEDVLIDVKTSSQIHKKLCPIQLVAYKNALENMCDIKVSRTYILHLTKEGKYRFKEFDVSSGYEWDIFTSLLKVKKFMDS